MTAKSHPSCRIFRIERPAQKSPGVVPAKTRAFLIDCVTSWGESRTGTESFCFRWLRKWPCPSGAILARRAPEQGFHLTSGGLPAATVRHSSNRTRFTLKGGCALHSCASALLSVFQCDPPVGCSLESGAFSPTIRIDTPVTRPTISAWDG